VGELEKLNSYTEEGTEGQVAEQATQPSPEAAAAEEQPASPTTGKGSKKRVPRKKSSAAATGEKRERGEGEEAAAGEETVEGVKKPKRTRTTKAARAGVKAAEGEAETGGAEGEAVKSTKKKGPGRPRKSSKKERDEVAAAAVPAEGEVVVMEVDVGGVPVAGAEKAPAAEGEDTALEAATEHEQAKRKRGPGRPKKSELADTATATGELGEGTNEDVPAARTRAKEGPEKIQQSPAIAA